PISEVRVVRIDGEHIINPNKSEMEKADLDIIVAATMDNVMMVEGEADEASEQELIEAIKAGHEAIKVQCQAQLDLISKIENKAPDREVPEPEENEEIRQYVSAHAADKISEVAHSHSQKSNRREQFKEILDSLKEQYLEEKGEDALEEAEPFFNEYFDELKKTT